MSNWIAVIQKVDNGYTVKYRDEDAAIKKVYEVKDDSDETNRDHFIYMIYDLIDYFSEGGSKHDKRRIKICYKSDGRKAEAKKGVEFEVVDE